MNAFCRRIVSMLSVLALASCSDAIAPTDHQASETAAAELLPFESVLTNGDFELGNLNGWTSSGATAVVRSGCHGGRSCARVGSSTGVANKDSALKQTMTVPMATPSITLWYQSVCRDTAEVAWLNVEFRSTTGELLRTLVSDTCTRTGIWQKFSTDIAEFSGQTIVLTLNNHDDGKPWNASYALFDDVSVHATTTTRDEVPPSVTLTAPANNATVSGTTTVSATASDNIAVARVEFFVDAMMLVADSDEPYSAEWATNGVGDGQHVVKARAFDAAGNSSEMTRTVQVRNGTTGTPGVGKDGGKVKNLYFAVVGDTRPAVAEDTQNYPKAIIEKIYTQLNNLNPKPQFSIGTGDYVFALPGSPEGQNQIDIYAAATKLYSEVVFPVLGNHECTGQTSSNCTDRSNSTFNSYMDTLLKPLGKTLPYFTIPVSAEDGSWTSKFVFIACNSWSVTQRNWLELELSQPTTHTFIIRHQPSSDRKGPCTRETDSIIGRHPYTLKIVGHEHTYERTETREVVIGNGGAPMTVNIPYGFAIIEQMADGFRVSQYDYSTAMPVGSFVVPF